MINTILFDLGNVLLPIDVDKTYNAFKNLGARKTLHRHHPLFYSWEKGEFSSEKFFAEIKNHLKFQAHPSSIEDAWNAMLLDLPEENLSLLKSLKKKYKLVLISNINHIHEQAIKNRMGAFQYGQLLKQFSGIYYSHHVGLRKPDKAFFDFVIEESNLEPNETLFIDDTEANILCANKLGFKSWHFNPAKDNLQNLPKFIKGLK